MLRTLASALILAATVSAAFFLFGPGSDGRWRPPEDSGALDRPASGARSVAQQNPAPTRTGPGAADSPQKSACPHKRSAAGSPAEIRIGSFEQPRSVPRYEILQASPDERDGACGTHLLVDTRARGADELTLITRDIKARYARYDAVSLEFTDTAVALTYNGGALIFNTPEGALYIGYVYGPPNNRGYIARAANR